MCGISGIITEMWDDNKMRETLTLMNAAMHHRGSDDEGIFIKNNVALGHKRLSIIDLSKAGHQPMLSHDNALAVVFNGEIYNYRKLKNELKDYPFKTNTDTEVIIAAYLKWGIKFIHHLDGMFAIALYDSTINTTYIIRDRLGVKPIYYWHQNGYFLFASEIRSLLASNIIPRKLNKDQLANFLTYQTTIDENTLIENIKMVPAGTYITLTLGNAIFEKYWQPNTNINNNISKAEAITHTRELLFSAIEKRMESDVKMGAFLSGGIDSSAVVGIMHHLGKTIHTYNVNFNEKEYSEAHYAQLIANKFNTNHTEINLKANDFIKILPNALKAMDYPSGDGVNTFVVSEAVKKAGITVSLSGVGSDEWFGGYPVFMRMQNENLKLINLFPLTLRNALLKGKIKSFDSNTKKYELLNSKVNAQQIYFSSRKLFTQYQVDTLLSNSLKLNLEYLPNDSNFSSISVAEWHNYLLPILLRDADQMGMANSLEIREPFLDYTLIEYLLSLPNSIKQGKQPKQLLVSALSDILPMEVVNRPKMGFVLPWQKWLKSELKLLSTEGINNLKNYTVFKPETIDDLQKKYFEEQQNISWNQVWLLAVLGNWLKENNIES